MKQDFIANITNDNDNLELLEIIKYLIGTIIDDIDLMNDLVNEKEQYDLGNNYVIKNDDLETLISTKETINDILNYNDK